jgi:hypothetical protein
MNKLTHEEYISKCLDEAEAKEENGTAVYYTEEECVASIDAIISEWEEGLKLKRCIS